MKLPLLPCILGLSLFAGSLSTPAAPASKDHLPKLKGSRLETYKTIGDVRLSLYVFEPVGHQATDRRPAAVFFFGGGWRSGSPKQFEQHCRYLASRGMVAMTADYRVSSRHQTQAKECVADGKSAIRWIRENASRLGIDPDRILAGGGSAGGHVAACTGVLGAFDEKGEGLAISSRPNAMALFNPALVLAQVEGREPLDDERMKDLEARMGVPTRQLSPHHHVGPDQPPTIVFHGQADTTVPYWTAEVFTQAMKQHGNTCKLMGYPGEAHGFFNFGRKGNVAFGKTLKELDAFLVDLGYLKGEGSVDRFLGQLPQ